MTRSWTRTLRLAALAAAVTTGLAACGPEPRSDQPLPRDLVALRLTGHTARVTDVTGAEYYLTFAYNGVVRVASDSPQYEHWGANEKGELCLQKIGGTASCAPLYQLTVERFRWGASILVLVR